MYAASLTIKYEWDKKSTDGLGLDVLGDSLIGFDGAIKEIIKILEIKRGVSVKAQIAKDGSIIFEILTQFITTTQDLPFENVQAYLDFLLLVGKKTIASDFEFGLKGHEMINKLYGEYGLTSAAIGYGIVKLLKFASKQKRRVTLEYEKNKFLPKKYAIKLHKIIKKRKFFKKALKPFVEGQISRIEIKSPENLREAAEIDAKNFEDYLSEDQRILPEYEDGETYRFSGRIVNLESSRGDYAKFKAHELKREHSLLVAYPETGSKTENYTQYYKKNVLIEAEVIRESLYQKPKLIINKIELMQKSLL